MIDVLYIAGAGRSGSTLLERLLGQLSGAVAVGELRHLWRENPESWRCGCGELLTDCSFWLEVSRRASLPLTATTFNDIQQTQRVVDRIRYVPSMLVLPLTSRAWQARHANYVAILRRLYEAIQEASQASVIVDSSKDISTLYLLSRMNDVRLRLLHLVRDSRAVAYSWTKEIVRPHKVDEVSYMGIYSPQWSAADWMYRNTLSTLASSLADRYMRLRYEDFIADPSGTLRRVADFMDLPDADPGFVGPNEVRLARATHTVAGNPMKFQQGNLRIRLDAAWQHALPQRDRRLVTALTWPLLWRYGYPLSTPAASEGAAAGQAK